jgi:hypothetical protein
VGEVLQCLVDVRFFVLPSDSLGLDLPVGTQAQGPQGTQAPLARGFSIRYTPLVCRALDCGA